MASRPFTPAPRHSPRKPARRRDRRARVNAASLTTLLRVIPSLPRPVLDRLTSRLIDRIDQMDGEADLEAGSWNERHDQGRYPRARSLLNSTDAELDDDDSGVDDQGEYTDDREPEDWVGGGGNLPGHRSMYITA